MAIVADLVAKFTETVKTPFVIPVVLAAIWYSWRFAKQIRPGQPDEDTDTAFVVGTVSCVVVYCFEFLVFYLADRITGLDNVVVFTNGGSYCYFLFGKQGDSRVAAMGRSIWVYALPLGLLWAACVTGYLVAVGKRFSELGKVEGEWLTAASMMVYFAGYTSRGWVARYRPAWSGPYFSEIMNLVVSVVVLGVALAGFYLMDLGKAILWLLFWVWAYPVALAFTKYGKGSPPGNLLKLYTVGVGQIPFVGAILVRLLDAVFGGSGSAKTVKNKRSDNSSDRTLVNPTPKPRKSRVKKEADAVPPKPDEPTVGPTHDVSP